MPIAYCPVTVTVSVDTENTTFLHWLRTFGKPATVAWHSPVVMAHVAGSIAPEAGHFCGFEPESVTTEVAPGVTFTLLPASEDPPSLYRLAFEPGARLYFAGDPAISLVLVESGAIALNMNAAVSDARLATPAGDASALLMDQGDYFVLPPLVAGEIRNDGEEPASIVIAAITPGLFPVPAAATPTAG